MSFQTFKRDLHQAIQQGGATFVLELGQNLNFSENSKDTDCAHDFDHLGEGQKKIPQQPIRTVSEECAFI